MAQQGLIARAGKRLLDLFRMLLRCMGALCAALGSILKFAWANEEPRPHSSHEEPQEVDDEAAKSYGWDSY